MVGGAVYYDLDMVFTVGGARNYDSGFASNRAYIIHMNGTEPVVERQPNMIWPRAFINVVVLPNGWIVCAGGQMKIKLFADTDGVLPIEIFDPVAKRFHELETPLKIRRNYHSVALLTKDGRVVIGGGGLCGIQCDYGAAGVRAQKPILSSSRRTCFQRFLTDTRPFRPVLVVCRTTPTLRS
jgi:galactose oxidase